MWMLVCLGWILGIATLGISIVPVVSKNVIVGLLLCSCVAAVWGKIRPSIGIGHWTLHFSCMLWGVTAFLSATYYAQSNLEQRLALRETQSKIVDVVVFVDKMDELTQQGSQQVIRVYSTEHQQAVNWLVHFKSTQFIASSSPLQIGQYYRLTGKVHPAHSYAVAGVFDQEKWYLQRNLQANFQVKKFQEISAVQAQQQSSTAFVQGNTGWLHRLNMAIEKQRFAYRQLLLQQPFQQKGLLLALLTGDESLLPQTIQQQFQQLGISHLLAISGPHVLIFAAMFCWFLHRCIVLFFPTLYLKYPKPFLLSLPLVGGVLFYCAFVGFEIPAWRTLLTLGIVIVSLWLHQKIRPFAILLCSAAIMLWLDPFSIWSAGFWLSYGSCFILLRIYQTCQQYPQQAFLNWKEQGWFYFKVAVQSQWKIFIALLPLTMLFFQKVSWLSPLANLLAVPWIGIVIVPLDIFASMLSWFSPSLGMGFYQLAEWNLSLLLYYLACLQKMIPVSLQWIHITLWQLACLTIGLFILFLPRGVLPKAWEAVCCLPLIFPLKYPSAFELQVLDVGQGQAIYVREQSKHLMIDTGGKYQEQHAGIGQQVLMPFFAQSSISRLDQVILTHLDLDHSGAFATIAPEMNIQQLTTNENPKLVDAIPFQYCSAGQHWQQGNLTIQVLSPLVEELTQVPDQRNELSCVLYLHYQQDQGQLNILIMGDAGDLAEQRILRQYPNLAVDVLILGHHGSRYSSSYAFLEKLKPKIAIASAGFDNRYGHPSVAVKQRLAQLNIPLYNTAELGSIRFSLNRHGELQQEFTRKSRRWLFGFS